MTMQLRITHTTGFEYDGPVAASYNEVRLTPVTSIGQIVAHTRLDVTPAPWVYAYRDYFGTHVTAFEVLDPHQSLRVVSSATVFTNRPEPTAPKLTWEEIGDPAVRDLHTEYLTLPDLVRPAAELVELAESLRAGSALPGEAARAVCALVHEKVEYRSGATDVLTVAAEAWEQRAGVCQDIAHVVVGTLRTLGIPARYVSGYLHPDKDAPVGTAVTGESHAWVEWWDDGWCAFDPTNDQPIGDRHVVIATGRDYGDVPPLSGIFSGSASSSMFVNVEVTRLA
jgi:transglutaminase-like putative cysteine protease